jgi:hypothetical protein
VVAYPHERTQLPHTVRAAMEGMSRVYLVTPGGSEQVEQAWIAVEAARGPVGERLRLVFAAPTF